PVHRLDHDVLALGAANGEGVALMQGVAAARGDGERLHDLDLTVLKRVVSVTVVESVAELLLVGHGDRHGAGRHGERACHQQGRHQGHDARRGEHSTTNADADVYCVRGHTTTPKIHAAVRSRMRDRTSVNAFPTRCRSVRLRHPVKAAATANRTGSTMTPSAAPSASSGPPSWST